MKNVIARIILVWFVGTPLMIYLDTEGMLSDDLETFSMFFIVGYPLVEAVWWAIKTLTKTK